MTDRIVLGLGASHTTLMNTRWDLVDHLQRAHAFRDALAQAGDSLRESRPDVVVVVGSNHFRGFWLDLMPAFTIGIGEVVSSGEHGTPVGILPSDESTGRRLCEQMLERNFDVAFSSRLTVDHGISHAVQWIIQRSGLQDLPIVPIIVNCFAHPLPSLKRTRAFGEALRTSLNSLQGTERIAVIGTGGLSHSLPFPDWRSPQTDDDEYLTESWKSGRGRWEEFEARRRSIIVNSPPRLNEHFDGEFLDLVREGRVSELTDRYTDSDLTRIAGNGAAEIRAWLVMAAALDYRPGRVLAYSPMPEWKTGMAVAVIPGHP